MYKKKVIILGAGLTGLSTAYHLKRYHIDTEIFEKEQKAGGLCGSKYIGDFTFDCDGHLLHFKTEHTLKFIKNLLKGNLKQQRRDAQIFCFNRFIPYPFQANLWALPFRILSDCILGFLKRDEVLLSRDNISFLKWIYKTFGEGIAKHFLIPYNQKFWCFPLEKIDCDWVNPYIPVLSTEDLIGGAIKKNRSYLGYNGIFWYPLKGGIESLVSAFTSQLKNIYTFSEAIKIEPENKRIYFKNGMVREYDCLISTIPLVELINMLEGVDSKIILLSRKLKWVSIFNLNLGVNKESICKHHWIYFPEKKYIFFRIGFFHNFSSYMVPKGMSSIYTEVSYLPSIKIDEEKITKCIINDLEKIGIVNKKDILVKDINNIKYGYIIPTLNHKEILRRIFRFLNFHGIYSIGRYGGWRYATMEDCILEGKLTAEKIMSKYG